MRRLRLFALVLLVLLVGATGAGPLPPKDWPPASPVARTHDAPTLAQQIGQRLVVRMDGTVPSAALLDRVRRGEVGGIVLFGFNLVSPAQALAAATQLRAAADEGGQPPLLLMVDQEGGDIRSVSWAPPAMSAWELGQAGGAAFVRERGRRAGAALLAAGIGMDLAPVADVPGSKQSFLYQAERVFSFDPDRVAKLSVAFARGLRDAGVLATVKHFPGIGRLTRTTDRYVETVTASRASLERDLGPFRAAIADGVPVVMLSNATYSALDPDNAAGWSSAIATTLLRDELGFTGVSITDSLSGTANARGVSGWSLAVRAIGAGTDMVMLTGHEDATAKAYQHLLDAASAGQFDPAALQASWDRIVALKTPG